LRLIPPAPADERVLVGHDTHDDAGVYQWDREIAWVQTIDFFTPVVDDPATFGAVAAVNALSDVYAMGGRPVTALNLVAFPAGKLPSSMLGEMMAGGQRVMVREGVVVLGGHSIDDTEPKIGYAVTGVVHPDHIWRNSTAAPGEILYLTKPVGTGVVIKAIKDARAEPDWAAATTAAMLETNRAAAELLRDTVGDPGACTDVTGFGLLGHAWEMAAGAGVTLVIEAAEVPVLPGAVELAREDRFPSGSRKNLDYVAPHLNDLSSGPPWRVQLLADAVTSGGLLFTVAPGHVRTLEQAAHDRGLPLYRIGRVTAGPPGVTLV
jgi:selenide,water dikinase